jgi:DNA-binding NtrC family response regulator
VSRRRILVVDDKPNFLALFRRIVGEEHELFTASDASEALACLARNAVDVVVSDVKMPGGDGIELLRQIKTLYPDTEVILMTAYGAVPDAVMAMKAGAYHYLTKPFDPDAALGVIKDALARRTNSERMLVAGEPRIIAASETMREVVELIARAARSDATVLITGESGTGKELVAREVHARSSRSKGRFVAVNCGALPESLIEAELFGVVKGAFTGATATRGGLFHEAAGGTLLLDEVAELPLALQVKLLRAVQERAVRRVGGVDEEPLDVRIVAATNVDVEAAVEEGKLREDLFYRLNVVSIRVPPLRERPEDIEPLAVEFLRRASAARGGAALRFAEDAAAALAAYDWPGNVRQLENAVARAVAVTQDAQVTAEALPDEITRGPKEALAVDLASLQYRDVIAQSRDQSSKEYLVALLKAVRGNVTAAAKRAGLERESLHRLLTRYGLRAEDFRGK